MKSVCRAFLLLIAVVNLNACGMANIAVKKEALSMVDSIALTKVDDPQFYAGNDFGNIGAAFGAVGGLAVGISSANASKSINQIALERGFTAGANLTEMLQKNLTSSGYQIKTISVSRENNLKLLDNYEKVNSKGADAILDVAIESVGYATEHPLLSPHWRPAAQVKVALVNSLTGENIYAEKFMYGYHNPFMTGTNLDAPEQYHFNSKNELLEDAALLIEGMQNSLNSIAKRVVQNLQQHDLKIANKIWEYENIKLTNAEELKQAEAEETKKEMVPTRPQPAPTNPIPAIVVSQQNPSSIAEPPSNRENKVTPASTVAETTPEETEQKKFDLQAESSLAPQPIKRRKRSQATLTEKPLLDEYVIVDESLIDQKYNECLDEFGRSSCDRGIVKKKLIAQKEKERRNHYLDKQALKNQTTINIPESLIDKKYEECLDEFGRSSCDRDIVKKKLIAQKEKERRNRTLHILATNSCDMVFIGADVFTGRHSNHFGLNNKEIPDVDGESVYIFKNLSGDNTLRGGDLYTYNDSITFSCSKEITHFFEFDPSAHKFKKLDKYSAKRKIEPGQKIKVMKLRNSSYAVSRHTSKEDIFRDNSLMNTAKRDNISIRSKQNTQKRTQIARDNQQSLKAIAPEITLSQSARATSASTKHSGTVVAPAVEFKQGDLVLMEFMDGSSKIVTITSLNDKFVSGFYDYQDGAYQVSDTWERSDIVRFKHARVSPYKGQAQTRSEDIFQPGDLLQLEMRSGKTHIITLTYINDSFVVGQKTTDAGRTNGFSYDRRNIASIKHVE